MTPTSEQVEIVKAVKTTDMLKICAVAGSGKSSTLKLIAEDNPSSKCLYLAYNKAMQLEAASKMPDNVECRTTHSIAYQQFGEKYQHKLTRPEGVYRNVAGTGSEIAKKFKIRPIFEGDKCRVSSIALGQLVKEAVAKFEQSSDEVVQKHHVDKNSVRIALKIKPSEVKANKQKINSIVDVVYNHAKTLWKHRVDVHSDVLITHDTYLKLYQLSKPVLDCDILLLDEAQDANPCFLAIVENNIGKCKIIFVGDEFQAIYGWRGAKNAMKMFDCKSLHLSKSFRYGRRVADIASAILEGVKVGGCEGIDTKVGFVNPDEQYTMLFRTNGHLIQTALELVAQGKKVNIQTDVRDLCKLITSAQSLYTGDMKAVKHESLFAYENWHEYKSEAESSGDGNLQRIVKYVETKQADKVLHYLNTHKNTDNPDVVLTTSHKAKGLEYDNVVLADDFPSGYVNGVWQGFAEQERNLLYVACTRAKKKIQLNNSVKEVLECGKFEINVRVFSAKDYLNNPILQLPHGELACEALGKIIDLYDDEDYHALEEEGGEGVEYEARDNFGEWIQSMTGTNPNHMPTLEYLEYESTVLGNLIK